MMKNYYLIIVLFVIGGGCQNENFIIKNNQKDQNIEYFKDFDIYNFIGKSKIPKDSLAYPYLSISEIGRDSLLINIYPSSYQKLTWNCHNHNGIHICHNKIHSNNDEDVYEKTLIVGKDETFEIEYLYRKSKEAKTLTKVSKLTSDNSVSYVFSRFDTIDFSLKMNFENYPKEKAKYKDILQTEISDNILKASISRTDLLRDSVIYEDITCYNLNELSIFWWSIAGNLFNSFKCGQGSKI